MPILISKCSVVFVVELLHERSSQFGGAKAWIKVKFTSLEDEVGSILLEYAMHVTFTGPAYLM